MPAMSAPSPTGTTIASNGPDASSSTPIVPAPSAIAVSRPSSTRTISAAGSDVLAGRGVGRRGVVTGQRDACAERPHPRQFRRVDVLRHEHFHRPVATAPGVGDRLTEVAGRRAHDGRPRSELAHEEVGAAALEAAQRVRRFHLDDDVAPQCRVEQRVRILRRPQEHGIDGAAGFRDAIEAQIHASCFARRRAWPCVPG